jgi:hypothetical protein
MKELAYGRKTQRIWDNREKQKIVSSPQEVVEERERDWYGPTEKLKPWIIQLAVQGTLVFRGPTNPGQEQVPSTEAGLKECTEPLGGLLFSTQAEIMAVWVYSWLD